MSFALFTLLMTLLATGQHYELEVERDQTPARRKSLTEIPSPTPDGWDFGPKPDYNPRESEEQAPVIAPQEPLSECLPNCSSWREAPAVVRRAFWPDTEPDEYPEPVDVSIQAIQLYDHYAEKYRPVRRVETWIYRRSYYEYTIHCNRARYYYFDVLLHDLEKGDRFEARITWEGGQHRTIERVMDRSPQTEIILDEPGYLEY